MAYEFDGNKYEQASLHQREWGERLIGNLSLKGNERVLDLGCGDGSLTARIAELVPEGDVLGIDSSRGMIASALSKTRENLHFQLLNIEKTDFRDTFGIIFSNAALHWIKNHETHCSPTCADRSDPESSHGLILRETATVRHCSG